MAEDFDAAQISTQAVRKDWVDLRDQKYVPNLSVLRQTLSLNHLLLQGVDDTLSKPLFRIRHQGTTGRCVGYALANLIDIQRHLQRLEEIKSQPNPPNDADTRKLLQECGNVSADMLYHMAFFHDRYPDLNRDQLQRPEGIRTLRSGVKGFYHHGVCKDWLDAGDPPEFCWPSTRDPHDGELRFPNVHQAKKAREISLGAYYRLASVLNHFHAALNDAQVVLATAAIHDGWLTARPEQGGLITGAKTNGTLGNHAFVITGYDRNGFHVLNSWGEKFGGYNGCLGIALWPYEDWARNILDAWVLRLGVPAPNAFDASIGEQGLKGVVGRGAIRTGSTPCLELVGHYTHLDDGYQVKTGSYPSFRNTWENTRSYLETSALKQAAKDIVNKQPNYRGVLIWIPGSLEGIKPAFDNAVARKAEIQALGLYPYNVFWCNNFVEKSLEVLQTLFDSCAEQAGENAAHLDDLIEERLRGVGRAFWRDIEISALRAVRGPGELPVEKEENPHRLPDELGRLGDFIADLMRLKADTGCEVHVVAEGAGVLVVHEILMLIKEATRGRHKQLRRLASKDFFDTLHLVHPAIGLPRANRELVKLMNAMNRRRVRARGTPIEDQSKDIAPLIKQSQAPRARLYIPSHPLEKRVCFGQYGKSILHLVSKAFEDRMPPDRTDPENRVRDDEQPPLFRDPRTFLGMAKIADDPAFIANSSVFRLNRIKAADHHTRSIPQGMLNDDPTIRLDPDNGIYAAIRGWREQQTRTSKKGN